MQKGKELKPHIGIFGRRNTGKSSFINALTGQETAIVSDQAGTTTDPVKKSIEIFGIGPAIVIDTAGIDDTGELGIKRIRRSQEIVHLIDAAILVTENNRLEGYELELISWFEDFNIPYFILHNKSDNVRMDTSFTALVKLATRAEAVEFSCHEKTGMDEVFRQLRHVIPSSAYKKQSLLGDMVSEGELVLLVSPIDTEAPEGRMKLPIVMVQRDILDQGGVAIVLKETELEAFLRTTDLKPVFAVTDGSQFKFVSDILGDAIPLTSYSMILARTRGDFDLYLRNTEKLNDLRDGDRILLLESCTHEVTCDDISHYKLPAQMGKTTGKDLEFDVINGLDRMEKDMSGYAMVIQCGGCVITRRQLESRLRPALLSGIPVTNYGMVLAWCAGIFERAVAPFGYNTVGTEAR